MLSLGAILPVGFEFDPREFAAVYRQAGAGFAQLCRPADAGLTPEQINRIAVGLPLVINSLHGFFGAACDISAPDESQRQAACRIISDEVRFCRDIGADMLVIHPRGDADPNTSLAVRGEQLARSLAELGDLGRRAGVVVAVENLHSPGFGTDPQDLLAAIQRSGAPNLGLCLDVGHAYSVGLPQGHLADLRQYVGCIHASDTEPGEDLHLLPGHGSVPWRHMFDVIQPVADTRVCLEVFEPLDRVRTALTPAWAALMGNLTAGQKRW